MASIHWGGMSVSVAVALLLAACDGPPGSAEPRDEEPAGIVGAWWRELPGPTRPSATQIFELRPDGIYVTFAPQHLQDRGRYHLDARTLHVESDLNPALKGAMGYRLEGSDHLTLTLGPPLNQVQEWKRVGWPPNFDIATVGSHVVPSNVNAMVSRMVLTVRDWWRADALPERLEFQLMNNLDMRATLDLCSPSDGACLRALITRYEVDLNPYQTPAGRTPVFPAAFLDLAEVVRIAHGLGYRGRLTKAGIGLGSPHWGLRFTGGPPGTAGLLLNGITGARVTHDMNEVMADYNRNWDEALARLRPMLEQRASGEDDEDCPYPLLKDEFSGRCVDDFDCERLGGGRAMLGSCVH